MRVLFFHMGPGLNGEPERRLLSDRYQRAGFDLHVWDEPSGLRPEGDALDAEHAFEGWARSARDFFEARRGPEPVVLIGHSCGARAVWEIARHAPGGIAGLAYVAPGLHAARDHLHVLRAAQRAFEKDGDSERATRLSGLLERYDLERYGEVSDEAWAVALECPRLFEPYWVDAEARDAYLPHLTGNYALDAASFSAVSRAMPPLPSGRSEIPALLVWGEGERVVDRAYASDALRQRHASLREVTLERAGHYPHLERAEAFLGLLEAFRA